MGSKKLKRRKRKQRKHYKLNIIKRRKNYNPKVIEPGANGYGGETPFST